MTEKAACIMKLDLDTILTANTKALKKSLGPLLGAFYPQVHATDDFIYAVGTIPMCLVASIDVPHGHKPIITGSFILTNDGPGCLGADDRAGVYAILEILRRRTRDEKPLPSVLFLDGARQGCRGAYLFCASDLWSRKDNVFLKLDEEETTWFSPAMHQMPVPLRDYMRSFDLDEQEKRFSDLSIITNVLRIPGVHLSVGIQHRGKNYESLDTDYMEVGIGCVLQMCEKPVKKIYQIPMETPAVGLVKASDLGDDWRASTHLGKTAA